MNYAISVCKKETIFTIHSVRQDSTESYNHIWTAVIAAASFTSVNSQPLLGVGKATLDEVNQQRLSSRVGQLTARKQGLRLRVPEINDTTKFFYANT